MDMSFQIIKAQPSDYQHISQLCQTIYVEHFLYLWLEGGKDWYFNKVYRPDIILSEIQDTNSDYFLLQIEQQSVGYLKVNYVYNQQPDILEVERIYFHKVFAGKGLGKKLMNFAFDLARQLHKQSVILKAMDSSIDSIAFYHKMGFAQIGTYFLADFTLMKPEYRGMVVLEKKINDVN